MSALDEIRTAVQLAVDQVGPSVVAVNRAGTGIVIGENRVLTNAHNLRGGGEALVQSSDGRWATATTAASDLDGDLAVLSVETGGALAVSWSDKPAQLGQVVVALANPRGRGMRATVGTVSSLGRSFRGPRGRRIGGGLEHTAPLGRGSSGGPVVDAEGHVLGVNTHRLQDGLYLAIPADADLQTRIDNLSAGRTPQRRRLGASVAPPQAARHLRAAAGLPEVDGLLITGVHDDSAAARSGLRRGDVLVTVGGQALTTIDDLHAALDGEGGTLEFGVVRANEELTIVVDFGA